MNHQIKKKTARKLSEELKAAENIWKPAKPTVVLNTYWRFAAKRQELFFNKLRGDLFPTDDPILKEYKFTNAYRAADRVSQFLIRNVIYAGAQEIEEVFFRILLFKIFNKIETWRLLEEELGEISYSSFRYKDYDKILTKAIDGKRTIFSAAYIMPSGASTFGETRKHRNYLLLLSQMMKDRLPMTLSECSNMRKAFELLLSYPMIGTFLAYQFVTDINYSTIWDFSETEFVVAGPGAKDGLKKCFSNFGGLSEEDIIRRICEIQDSEFERLGLKFNSLWGRRLQYIDCQNLFCEVDKYARVAHPEMIGISGRKRIKQKYKPALRLDPIDYLFPAKWGINEKIKSGTF